jgi:hypothetical protein
MKLKSRLSLPGNATHKLLAKNGVLGASHLNAR